MTNLILNLIATTCLLAVGSQAMEVNNTMESAMAYIKTYFMDKKYLKGNPDLGELEQPLQQAEAIKAFQRFCHINETGIVDTETMKWMNMPRCGMADMLTNADDMKRRKKRFAVSGSRWNTGTDLTWDISVYSGELSRNLQEQIFTDAFDTWSREANIRFRRASSGETVVFDIQFVRGNHGDGVESAFDGPGGTLAHAYFPTRNPIGGDGHYDEDESWSHETSRGINLLQVAVHEIGHALGLRHSDVNMAVMAPFYQGYDPNFELHFDDIAGIQQIYGQRVNVPSTRPTPQTTSTTTTRRTTTTRATTRSSTRSTPSTERTTTTRRTTPTTTPTTTTRTTTTSRGDPTLRQKFCSNARFDAITQFHDRTFAFKGDVYAELNLNGIAPGYPRLIASDWEGLESDIDAALYWPQTPPRLYIFKGSQYYRYERGSDGSPVLRRGYPIDISRGFRNLPNDLDFSFVWGRNGRSYLFKGDNYYRLYTDSSRNRTYGNVDSGYPRSTLAWRLPLTQYDSAFQWENGRTYFFRGDQYYRYDDQNIRVDADTNTPYPRSINTWWTGCRDDDMVANIEMEDESDRGFLEVDPFYTNATDATTVPPSGESTDPTGSARSIQQGMLLLPLMAVVSKLLLV